METLIDIACRGYLTAEARFWSDIFAKRKPAELQAHRIWHWALKRWGAERWPYREYEIREKEYGKIFERNGSGG